MRNFFCWFFGISFIILGIASAIAFGILIGFSREAWMDCLDYYLLPVFLGLAVIFAFWIASFCSGSKRSKILFVFLYLMFNFIFSYGLMLLIDPIRGHYSLDYYIIFLLISLLPLGIGILFFKKKKDSVLTSSILWKRGMVLTILLLLYLIFINWARVSCAWDFPLTLFWGGFFGFLMGLLVNIKLKIASSSMRLILNCAIIILFLGSYGVFGSRLYHNFWEFGTVAKPFLEHVTQEGLPSTCAGNYISIGGVDFRVDSCYQISDHEWYYGGVLSQHVKAYQCEFRIQKETENYVVKDLHADFFPKFVPKIRSRLFFSGLVFSLLLVGVPFCVYARRRSDLDFPTQSNKNQTSQGGST